MGRYRKGTSLASCRDRLDRAERLLSIHKNLRLIFPKDIDLAYRWMTQRNRAFEGRTPAEMIRELGFTGMLMVCVYLERELES